MSTSYIQTNRPTATLYMGRELSENRLKIQRNSVPSTQTKDGIDEDLLKIGIFCFLVPIMFSIAAFGLHYLEMSDVLPYSFYIIAGVMAVRIATAIIIKGMAAEKNRSESVWMTIAMIVPAISLILMSFVSTRKIHVAAASNTIKMKSKAPVREMYVPHKSQAI